MKFGQLFLRKIVIIVATKCQNFKAKMHPNRFRLGLCPDPAGGAYSAPPDPLAGFKGPTSKGGRRREGRERPTYKGREVKGGRGGK